MNELRIVCHALTGYYEGRVSVDPESARHVNPLAMSARVVVVKALDAAEAVSQTRLGHHIRVMVGPLTLIRSNVREDFALVFATTLPETDLFCCVIGD